MLFTALAETVVHAAHALAQMALHRQAALADRAQAVSAVTLARESIAAAIAAGGDPRAPQPVAPSPAATCAVASSSGCAMFVTATIAFSTPPAATPSPCPSGACTIFEQGNDEVDEGRVDATIFTQTVSRDGVVLASRTHRATFRTWRVPPYAALDGRLDASVGALEFGPGDDGGAAPNGAAPGTLIDVLYENRVSGATMPANVWQSQVQHPVTAPAAWSP